MPIADAGVRGVWKSIQGGEGSKGVDAWRKTRDVWEVGRPGVGERVGLFVYRGLPTLVCRRRREGSVYILASMGVCVCVVDVQGWDWRK